MLSLTYLAYSSLHSKSSRFLYDVVLNRSATVRFSSDVAAIVDAVTPRLLVLLVDADGTCGGTCVEEGASLSSLSEGPSVDDSDPLENGLKVRRKSDSTDVSVGIERAEQNSKTKY